MKILAGPAVAQVRRLATCRRALARTRWLAARTKLSPSAETPAPQSPLLQKLASFTPPATPAPRETAGAKPLADWLEALNTRPQRALETDEQPARNDNEGLVEAVRRILDEQQADNVCVLNVREKADWTQTLIVAEGRNSRHLYRMLDAVALRVKHRLAMDPAVRGLRNYGGVEREDGGGKCADWVTLDLATVVLHCMLPEARQRYDIEGLWRDAPVRAPLGDAATEAQRFLQHDFIDGCRGESIS